MRLPYIPVEGLAILIKSFSFRVAMREHGKLRFNPVPYLLALAFADGALFDMDSPKDLECWDPDNNEPTRLLWRPHIVKEPIIRTVTRFDGASGRALNRDTFCRLFRNIANNAGYYEIITIHSLRRGLANRIDSKSRFLWQYFEKKINSL